MSGSIASLNPVSGGSRDLWELVREWVDERGEPIGILTSGSTGEPKTIRLTREAVLASAQASIDKLGGPGRWLLAIPPTSAGGFQVLVRSALAGIEPVFLDEFADLDAALAALGAIAVERTYASFVPTQLYRLAEQGNLGRLASLDAVLLGGGPSSSSLLRDAGAAGVNIVRTYGMTETAGGCVYDGVPLAGVDLRIEPDGRIALSGPMLFDGAPVWWVTEDLGRIGADGTLEVLGRADDVAISGGVNISLSAVEQVLSELDTVQEVAVVARDDAEWGQAVTAFVRGALTRDEAKDALIAAGYRAAWTPRRIEIVTHFPLLATGKIDKRTLASIDSGRWPESSDPAR